LADVVADVQLVGTASSFRSPCLVPLSRER
jgi:hypothetical protein